MNISEVLDSLVASYGGNKAEIGRRLGISGQLLGQYIAGKKSPKPDFYVKWKKEFGDDLMAAIETKVPWPKLPGVSKVAPEDDSIHSIAESNRILAEATKIQAEANKALSEAHLTVARNNEELIKLLLPTVNASFEKRVSAQPTEAQILELKSLIGPGKRWASLDEVRKALDRFAVEE